MHTAIIELRAAQVRAGQLADMPMIRRLAVIARVDHETNARYRVYRSEVVGMRRQEATTASGLIYAEARLVADRLNTQMRSDYPSETSWRRPLFLLQMEPRSCLVEVPSGYMTDDADALVLDAA